MPSVSDEQWNASIDKFRDVTKWILAGIGALISLILGSSPLTGLGSLEPGWRLLLAIESAGVGLVGLAFIFWAAVDVLRARLTDLQAFVEIPSRERDQVNEIMIGRLPPRIRNITELWSAKLAQDLQPPQQPDADEQDEAIEEAVRTVTRVAAFVIADELFGALCRKLTACTLLAVVGFGTYEWAVNPPKPDPQASKNPLAVEATITLKNAVPPQAATGTPSDFSANCAAFRLEGQSQRCIAEAPPGGGRSDHAGTTYVSAPSVPIDLVGLLMSAIESAGQDAKQLSPFEMAKRSAQKFLDSMSAELGTKVVDFLFTEDQKPRTEPPRQSHMEIVFIEKAPLDSSPPARQQPVERIQVYPFVVDSARLPDSDEWRQQLSALVNRVHQQPCNFEVRGFTDRRGRAYHNLYLSLQRADAVAAYLQREGVPRERIQPTARGAFGTRFETDEAGDLAMNRRVEVLVRCEEI
jgi:outer membrane protein OmpA-like peptidoglycan-associated protein